MKKYKLDAEEQDLLDAIERGEFVSVPHAAEEIKKIQTYAQNTLNKTKNINIRISVNDLNILKDNAQENGLPYQTLLSTLIRQYTSGKIKIEL